jgi:hypothetical protein
MQEVSNLTLNVADYLVPDAGACEEDLEDDGTAGHLRQTVAAGLIGERHQIGVFDRHARVVQKLAGGDVLDAPRNGAGRRRARRPPAASVAARTGRARRMNRLAVAERSRRVSREISRSGDTPVAVGSQTAARVPPIRRTACIVG